MPRRKKEDEIAQAATKYKEGMPKNPEMQERCIVLGKNLREERKNRKFTMEELVNMLAISESYLGLLERGKRTPSLECLFEFCKTFGVTPNELLMPRNGAAVNGKSKKSAAAAVGDGSSASQSENLNAALSLLRSLNNDELEYIISVMVGLQKMQKNKKKVRLT
jgi:transcriptional regulator with XRE-family HTH domain